MSAKLLEGKVFAAKLREEAGKRAEAIRAKYGVNPGLAVIIVGENPASQVYVRNKHKACTELGFYSEGIEMSENTTREELLAEIDRLNKDEKIHGILVQLPLPKALQPYESEVLEVIDPLKDVDGFHPVNVGRMATGQQSLLPCTPHGCIRMLELADIPMDGANAVVIGRSNIVGKPKFVTADMVKPGAAVIDVGINRIAPKKLVGDVDFDAVKEVAGAITPVPGGVGLLTIAMLMQNTVAAAEMQLAAK